MKTIIVVAALISASAAARAAPAPPSLLWASHPVFANQTALLWGSSLAGVRSVTILGDTVSNFTALAFDVSPNSLKFILPQNLPDGIHKACVAASVCIEINRPDPWWFRGDVNLTHASTQGGWIRVFAFPSSLISTN